MGELTARKSGRPFAWLWLLHSMQSKCLAVLIYVQINAYFIRAKKTIQQSPNDDGQDKKVKT